MGFRPELPGLPEDLTPTTDELIAALSPEAGIPLEEIKKHPSGKLYGSRQTEVGGVIPEMIGHADKRIAVGHPDIIQELQQVLQEQTPQAAEYDGDGDFEFRVITYRMKKVYCTTGHNLPSLRSKHRFNPALMNAEDVDHKGFKNGERVELDSGFGRIEAIIVVSDEIAPGVIGLAHGWGDPLGKQAVDECGSNVQVLIPRDKRYDKITGLAQQSAYPVNVFAKS